MSGDRVQQGKQTLSFYNAGQCNVVEKPQAERDGEATQRLAVSKVVATPLLKEQREEKPETRGSW